MPANSEYDIPRVCPRKLTKVPPEEEIVISGIAGRFPESDNLQELHENLISKKDLISDDDRRWKLDHQEIPHRTGKINNIEKFDAAFFGVHFKQSDTMDPMCRMLLEHAYEAVIDAGVNPQQLHGTKTGVFIGACFSESEIMLLSEELKINELGFLGNARTMLANRISYWFNINGPSYTIDTACSSSLYAMEQAYKAIREGHCDAAIVGAGNLCLHPYISMQFSKMGALSADGRCKTFDEAADGYVRGEAVSVAFLQKAKDAKRIYATFVHAKTNCDGFKEQGITFPSSHMQSVLLDEFYLECGVLPASVGYVEAHGTGTVVGDPQEVNAIDKVLGKNRTKNAPLLIGSVKSNLGHTECASGLLSVCKVLMAMETGVLQPNINFKNARKAIDAFAEKRIRVVSEVTPWKGGYAGINGIGLGGTNAHILLKSNAKIKINKGAPNDDLPRLVTISGRSNNAVSVILKDLESKPVDVEYVRLLHEIHSSDIKGHLYRGFTVLPPRGVADTPVREIKSTSGAKRPIWFVFSGMGSQWPGMGKALLRIPVFAEAIKKCDAVLKHHGIDIFHIITNKDKTAFDNILNSFVGIAAVQIGLVDVLYSIGIKPDQVIGHSFGELGCAYADGCFTAEQTIMSAYYRGLVSIETKFIPGAMAVVSLGYQELKYMCPPDVVIACHNSSESATISGPAHSVKNFLAELQAEKIFTKELYVSNIPYHSHYITSVGPRFLAYLKEVIPDPKARSSKWLSTSVTINEWDTSKARLSSAEYHTNNLLSSVLFEEVTALIPKNAIVIEIAPHGLLKAILRTSLSSGVSNISLMRQDHINNVEVLLQAIGKMFNEGLHPQLANIYPLVEYPVSRTTPMISPLIRWEHSRDWHVTTYKAQTKITSSERTVEISLAHSDYEYIAGHTVNGRKFFPATGYLVLIWETLGLMHGEHYADLSVVFEKIKFIRATILPNDETVEFTLMIQKGTGRFEVVESGSAVVTGYVRVTTDPAAEQINAKIPVNSQEEIVTSRDFYKECSLRGYNYSGIFCGVTRSTINRLKGHIRWHNNWVVFMDSMLQMSIIGKDTRELFIPTSIKKLTIDTTAHLGSTELSKKNKEFSVHVNKLQDVVVSGGIEISGARFTSISFKQPVTNLVLEEYKFVPFTDRAYTNLYDIARLSTHISLENHLGIKVRTIEYIDEADEISFNDLLSPRFSESFRDIPFIQADISIVSTIHKFEDVTLPSTVSAVDPRKLNADANALLVVGHRLLTNDRAENLDLLLSELKECGFVLSREKFEDMRDVEHIASSKGFHVILEKKCGKELFVLLKKQEKLTEKALIIQVNSEKFDWIEKMRKAMSELLENDTAESARIFLVGQGDFDNGLMGLINCLKQETGGDIVRGVLIQDPKAPEFSLRNPLFAKQVQKDLSLCVLRENGVWGSYRHLPLPPLVPRPVRHMWLNQMIYGDISSLMWFEGPIHLGYENKDLVHIIYSSINYRDVMLTTGKIRSRLSLNANIRRNEGSGIGFEYCGIDTSGKRIMGMTENQCVANLCIADRELAWEVPDRWSFEDAATIPVAYGTCYYGLYIKGKMRQGKKILVHSGSGDVGQAAINLALYEGCEVFTTVGTPEKRQFIRQHFPQIREDHIGNSRDTSFVKMIMEQTNGQGVDIVLNSLEEEKLQASVSCLAWGGQFLQIGKLDLAANNSLGMECFLREVSFQGIMLDHVIKEPTEHKAILNKLLADGMKSGAVKPLIRTVFPRDQAEAAILYMAAGKHIGKVILKMRDEKESVDTLGLALPRYYCLADRSYIILGGLGGCGLELADWLVLRGAKNLVITSRTGMNNGYQEMRVALWRSYGVNVVITTGKEASKLIDCQFIIETAAQLAPVDGIFNLAVVLKDALWENQTPESFEESFRCKAWATKNLDVLSRKLCPALRHFVVFSSVSCGKGNAGQTNYGMSNSVMERICERRVAEGLPGLAIQWGALGDVGLLADSQEVNKEVVIAGTVQQKIASCLQELDRFLEQTRPVVLSMVVAEKNVYDGQLNIVNAMLKIMGFKDLKDVSLDMSLAELGMDSLLIIEIKLTLEREFDIFLSAQDTRSLTFTKLLEMSGADESSIKKINRKPRADIVGVADTRLLWDVILGNENHSPETCLRLLTREEADRSEIFLVPGIAGVASVFASLAPKLRAPATCLQLGFDDSAHKSIFDMADSLLPHVQQKSKEGRFFLLVGYSFGCLIAIELARRLEAQGFNGQIILIDGAPDQLKAIQRQQIAGKNETELENESLLEILNVVSPDNCPQLADSLEKCTEWDDKLQAFTKFCPTSKFGLSEENQKHLCTAIYRRIMAIRQYDVSQLDRIKAPIFLLKPTTPSARLESENYGLSKITSNTVEVQYIPGNHATILDDDSVAYAINGKAIGKENYHRGSDSASENVNSFLPCSIF